MILLAVAFTSREKPTDQLLQEAIAFQASGQHEAAAIQLKNVLAREPAKVEANLRIGRSYLAAGALLDAEKALRRAEKLGAPSVEVVPDIARALIGLDRFADALKVLGEGAVLKVSGAQVAIMRGQAYLGSGNFVGARTQFSITRHERPTDALTGLARIRMLEGDPDAAFKQLEGIEDKYPQEVATWLAKGDFLRVMGKSGESLVAYQQAQKVQSDNLEAILGAAIVLIGQDSLSDARKELRKAQAVSPSSHVLKYANAVLAFRERRYQECRSYYKACWRSHLSICLPCCLQGT